MIYISIDRTFHAGSEYILSKVTTFVWAEKISKYNIFKICKKNCNFMRGLRITVLFINLFSVKIFYLNSAHKTIVLRLI